jgi:O-acetyl-ADP-ribose deacetylase (regulator of RNase III)
MIAQRDVRVCDGVPPIRYAALKECLITLNHDAKELRASVHMPRIGCGLAGGRWEMVEPLVRKTLSCAEVFVYDLPRS